MNTVTLSIASREDITRRALAALGGERQGAHISFEVSRAPVADLDPEALGIAEVDDRRGRHDDPRGGPARRA